jgi:hypothetical protein
MAERAIVEDRIQEAMAALAIGQKRDMQATTRKLAKKWGVSVRTVRWYFDHARARLRRSWDEKGPDMAALVFESYTDLYRHSIQGTLEPHQIQNARAILDRMTALAGLTGT